MRLLALALALALAPTLAAAQEVGGLAPPPPDTGYAGGPIEVPLYAHIYDLLQTAPLNTQPMIDLDLARGFGTPSVDGAGPLETPASLRFVSTPGLVEYNITEDGFPRMHPERGISYDVLLDTSKPIVGHFWLGVKPTDVPQQGQTGGPEIGVAPGLTVRMTMRVGDDIGGDLDAGEIIGQGQTTLGPEAWAVNGAPVEFVVDMGTPLMDRLPGIEAFNVLVEWFNAEAPDGSVRFTQRDWVVHTGSQYPNRVDITVVNPLALYALRPTPLGDDRVSIHAVMNSPFGNYDVDVANITMSVSGPSTPQRMEPPRVVQRSFEHNHHYEPVELTWVWNFHQESAAPGTYSVTVEAPNLQGTATVQKTASFTINEGGRAVGYDDGGNVVIPEGQAVEAETPFLGAALLAAVVLGAAALRRRT